MRTYQPVEGVKFEVGPDMESTDTRIVRGVKIGSQATQSPLYANVEVKPAIDGLLSDTVELKKAVEDHNVAQASYKKARSALVAGVAKWDGSYRVLVASAEKHCATADDGTGLGLVVRGKTKYPLAPPVAVELSYDVKKGLLRIHVIRAPGNRSVCVEVSSEPMTPTSWLEQPGHGAVHEIKSPPPGILWVRAASRGAKAKSEFTTPVSVLVK